MKHEGFTPGPWTADRLEGHVFTLAVRDGENPDHTTAGRLIANCMGHSSNFEDIRDEQQANACLIAAAPTLLAQRDRLLAGLKRADAAMERHDKAPYKCESCEGAEAAMEARDEIVAAIAAVEEKP